MVEKLVFTSIVHPNKYAETNALLLVESIRAFAGSLSKAPIWMFTPGPPDTLSPTLNTRLKALNVTLNPFTIQAEGQSFFFVPELEAIVLAESQALTRTQFLVWMNSNTLVLQEPTQCLLSKTRTLGYRPVHHINIGSHWDQPLDSFWTEVYRVCQVSHDRIFPMTTHIDEVLIRPYVNAGFLITRPQHRLFKQWRDTFLEVYQEPVFQEFYQHNQRYKIFMHQAILSALILTLYAPDELEELPPTYNYPLHLFAEDVSAHAPTTLDDRVTLRHEGFYRDPDWFQGMPIRASRKEWIAERLTAHPFE